MGKVRDVVLENFGWKLLSLFTAIVLWFVGMNMHDPTIVKDYPVKLTIRNKDKVTSNNFVLLNEKALESSTVTITYRGRRSAIESLDKRRTDIVASIDLSPIDISMAKDLGESLPATVTVELPTGANIVNSSYERVNVYPATANIELDYLAHKEVELSVSNIGKAAEGYVALNPVAEPESVRLTGAKSLIDTIASAKVEVELDAEKKEDFVVTQPSLKIYNADGGEITEGISVDETGLVIQVPVRKYAEIEILTPFTVNPDPERYEISSVSISPQYAQVIGTEEDIAALPYITLPSIRVDSANGLTYSSSFDLRSSLIDTKLSIKEGTPQEVQVTVTLSEISEREFSLDRNDITVAGAPPEAEIGLPETITVMLHGATSRLDAVNGLKASIDLTDLAPGAHTVALSLELPERVTAVEETEIPVMIMVATDETPGEGEPGDEEPADEDLEEDAGTE